MVTTFSCVRTKNGLTDNYMSNMNTKNATRRDAPSADKAHRITIGLALPDLRGWRLRLVAVLVALLARSA